MTFPGRSASPGAPGPRRSRRTVLRGAALASAGVAATCLTGCEHRYEAKPEAPDEPVELGPADEVPVGEARLYERARLLVSRPEEDTFLAWSAVCTHLGCLLSPPEGTVAECPCHNSRFDTVDGGRPLAGPAYEPLLPVPVRVNDEGVLVAGESS
ncbi:Rieske (2Fe-2S) protein [Streptomyces calidiresistens]|uniref:Cytochrome bc1 complex Rieske iron-sulfur subunit n=1 Tax=Streptomyces calidiresistens TaxID=1485586 RepID=A0A7W3T5G0_9ACTN|nr:Rieske 2Fe-2S domain-containing protein [Streptomyces calidiresistens]MBB0231269.1 Rieske 2Fe-2S domain-containing protein [Streptomyces calidiresistens]